MQPIPAHATQPPNNEQVAIRIPIDSTVKTDTPITEQNLPVPQWADQVGACMRSPEKLVINANGKSVCSPSQTVSASPEAPTPPPETLNPPQVETISEPPRISPVPPATKALATQTTVQDISNRLDNARKAVVLVENNVDGSGGSGFVISDDGYIVTNAHVVMNLAVGQTAVERNGKRLSALVVKLDGSEDLLPVDLIAFDYQGADLALLRIKQPHQKELTKLELAQSEPQVGEPVYTIGSPWGNRGDSRSLVTSGIVSGTSKTRVVTNAETSPGNSGGPVLNLQGKVIGVATSSLTPNGSYTGIKYAVSAKQVEAFLKNRKKGRFALVAQQEGRNAELKRENPNQTLPVPLLQIDSLVSGRIDSEDLVYGNEVYEFEGKSGQKITIEVKGDGEFVPSLIVELVRDDEAKPIPLHYVSPQPNSTLAKLEFLVPEDGNYLLSVNPLKKLKNNETGTYELTIR